MTEEWQNNPSATGDINILLLGPTGVGKTTFINAFANYLVYNSLDEAIDGELQAVIPATFIYTDKNTFDQTIITVGTPNKSEQQGAVGESCTRECRSFVFRIGNRRLRLLDTPGVGDTQGVLQDEKNFEDILAYIAQLEYLNGICILLHPNHERLDILFRYGVKELLRHLHVHAQQNIMFVFTNARSTGFDPGASTPILKKLLQSLKDQSGTEVPFTRANSFFFDNESFRFLALCKNGIEISSTDKKDYSRSWNHIMKEFNRLIARIIKCDKHATRDTLSLNEAQQLIRKLSRPIGEISTLIQENIQLAQQHKNNVMLANTPTPQILPQVDARLVPLGYPRTVCTNIKCTQLIIIDGLTKVDYASHCHPHCFLHGVEMDTIGHEKLRSCAAINQITGNCVRCKCIWKEHMHITYEFQKFMNQVNISVNDNGQSQIDVIEKRIKDLKYEQEEIIKVCTQLTQFLQVNSLNPINDDILEYIEHFIKEEQMKKNAGAQNDGVIEGLKKLLADYKCEIEILQKTKRINATTLETNAANQTNTIRPEEIFLLVGSLYRLPINGAKIRAQVNEVKSVQQRFTGNREQTVNLPAEANSSSVMADLKYVLT